MHVLATLEESSYAPGANAMGVDHPIAWCHNYDGGRAWYTGGGHTTEAYGEQRFIAHVLGGIKWAANLVTGDCGATQWSNFERVTLAQSAAETGEPIGLAVLPDKSVLHTSRDGVVATRTRPAPRRWRPPSPSTTTTKTDCRRSRSTLASRATAGSTSTTPRR